MGRESRWSLRHISSHALESAGLMTVPLIRGVVGLLYFTATVLCLLYIAYAEEVDP